MKLYFVTGNKSKFKEVKQILEESDIEIEQAKIDLPELQGSPEYVAKEKAKLAFEILKKPVFIDDTSLSLTALNGMPGVYIKDFLNALGHKGMNEMLNSYEDKSATACVTIAYCDNKINECVQGKCEGKIVTAKFTGNGHQFGWDPIFEPNGFDGETFGTLSSEIKNSISHRKKAIENFKKWIKSNL